jgi:hypothetical protein
MSATSKHSADSSLDDLVGAATTASAEYVRDLRAWLPRTLDELIAARDHGVSPEQVRLSAALGDPRMSPEYDCRAGRSLVACPGLQGVVTGRRRHN